MLKRKETPAQTLDYRSMLDATPMLRSYAGLRALQLQTQDAIEVQQWVLRSLLWRAASTRFGREHGFSAISTVSEFQERVPLRHYEDFWRDYWQPVFPRLIDCTWPGTIPYFARTSGTTTGQTKYIPCSHEMVAANLQAGEDLLVHHVLNRPRSRLLEGKCLILGGSTDLREEAPGIRSGDLSGIEAWEIPWWARPWVFPPREVALVADWEEKIDRIARLAVDEDIRAISGAPNWLLLFFDRLMELRPRARGLRSSFPKLELIIHGGISFAPYRDHFRRLIGETDAETREVYAASEAFVAVADRGDGEGLRLIVDNDIFYEFVPVAELARPEPVRHWIADVETGVEYAVAVSTCAGAWAYILGDTVRFLDLEPPRLLVTGRLSYVLSAFGEHLIAEEIEEAVRAAASSISAAITDYSVGPVFPERPAAAGGHLYLVEFGGCVPDAGRITDFAHKLDQTLVSLNADYGEHRARDFGLRAPQVEAVRPGTFAAWMKSRGKLGGQHKIPRVINDLELFDELREFAARSNPLPSRS